MASYKVIISNSVRQDVRGIERIQLGRIMAQIRSLAETPFPSGCKKLKGSIVRPVPSIIEIIQTEGAPQLLKIFGRIPDIQANSHVLALDAVARCFNQFIHTVGSYHYIPGIRAFRGSSYRRIRLKRNHGYLNVVLTANMLRLVYNHEHSGAVLFQGVFDVGVKKPNYLPSC
jgi:hypothetical protein